MAQQGLIFCLGATPCEAVSPPGDRLHLVEGEEVVQSLPGVARGHVGLESSIEGK